MLLRLQPFNWWGLKPAARAYPAMTNQTCAQAAAAMRACKPPPSCTQQPSGAPILVLA